MESLSVRKLKLQDVGPFTDVEVSFPGGPGLNLVCGDNGIGKTSILESIIAMFSRGHLRYIKKRQAGEHGTITLDFLVNDVLHQFDLGIESSEPNVTNWHSPQHHFSRNVIAVRAARDFGYTTQSSINRDPQVDENNIDDRVSGGLEPHEIKTWFSNRYLLEPHADSMSWTPQMIQNLNSAKQFFSLLDPLYRLNRVDVKTFDIIVTTPSGDLPFEYLSSGFRSTYILLLGIIKEIEYRNLDVSAAEFSGLIIIDEIDLHLHPTWQREIGNALKGAFPKAQIIASTHSPHVIQAAQASEVVALVREKGDVVKQRTVPSTKYGYAGWSLEEVLEDIMGVKDTKTSLFRSALWDFDTAVDHEDADKVLASRNVLLEMLHPHNSLRKLIEIQAAPFVGAADPQ